MTTKLTKTTTEFDWDPQDGNLIHFEDVFKSFRGQTILNGLSFNVKRGTTFAIMGGSGTGKSVTLRHVVGLLAPDEGRVTVAGREPSRLSSRELRELRRNLGYLFQDGALINWLSVFDNIALPLREALRLDESNVIQLVDEALERVHLEEAGAKMPSEISGGMRKRVALARAIVGKPQILLYDEPNAGLDPAMATSINSLIREVQEGLGVTSIVVTHRRECALHVADVIAIFEHGQILKEGTPAELLHSGDPRILQFLGVGGWEVPSDEQDSKGIEP